MDDNLILNEVKELLKTKQAFKKACECLAKHIDYDLRCPALFDNSAYKTPLPCVDGNYKANYKHCKKINYINFAACCWQLYFLNKF